jgi:acyl homoserine lactone synthase
MLMRCGCAGEPLGPPQLIGGVETYAVLYEVGPGWDARVRNLAGVASVTLEPEAIRNMQARLAC